MRIQLNNSFSISWKYFLVFCGTALAFSAAKSQNLAKAADARIVVGAGTQVNITGGIQFTGSTQLTNNGNINILKNPLNAAGGDHWADSTVNVMNSASTGTVSFKSDRQQELYGPTVFYNLETSGAGIQLLQSNEVRNNLLLNGGLVFFANSNDSLYVSNAANAAISSSVTFNKSFIHGKLARRCNTTLAYLFPVGKIKLADSLYAPVQFQKVNTNAAVYTAVYFPNLPPDAANFLNPPIDHISQLEYWEISSNILSGVDDDARLTLTWRSYSAVGATAATRDSLMVAHYIDNSGFRWEPEYDINQANIVAGTVTNGSVTTNINVGSFVQAHKLFTLASRSPFNKLPLDEMNWSVRAVNQTAAIQWNVVNDVEVAQYTVERSLTGALFTPVGQTASAHYSGAGAYRLTDGATRPGWNYYRIKLTDRQGRITYTDIKKVFIGTSFEISVYPNPASRQFTIQFSHLPAGATLAEITDAVGRVLLRKPLTGLVTAIPVSGWAAGTYYVNIITPEGRFAKRIAVQ